MTTMRLFFKLFRRIMVRENLKEYSIKKRNIDFSDYKYLGELHQEIKEKLELPDWYGENLDALWDSLTGIMYVPAEITITYLPKVNSVRLKEEVYKIIHIFKEAEKEYDEIIVHVVDK